MDKNFESLVKKYGDLIGKKFKEDGIDGEYIFFGIVYGADDYYFGFRSKGERGYFEHLSLISCVGDLDQLGFRVVE